MPTPAFEDLVDTFEFLDDWEERYRHLIEIGRDLPEMDPALKTPATKVSGCASQVWLLPRPDAGKYHFLADSDAVLVRGLVAVLQRLYDGVPVDEVKSIDVMAQMARLGLDEHLSAQRANGLASMVARIRSGV